MQLEMFAVLDRASGLYGNVMFFVSRGAALRSFTDEVNREDAQNALFHHPEDFVMHYLGTFDNESALFEAKEPELFVRATDVRDALKEKRHVS